jgi:hypothetical protein
MATDHVVHGEGASCHVRKGERKQMDRQVRGKSASNTATPVKTVAHTTGFRLPKRCVAAD